MEVPQENKTKTTIEVPSFTSWCLPKGIKITILKTYLSLSVQCRLIYKSQDKERTRIYQETNEFSKNVANIQNRILLNHKKKEILPFVTTWMVLRALD